MPFLRSAFHSESMFTLQQCWPNKLLFTVYTTDFENSFKSLLNSGRMEESGIGMGGTSAVLPFTDFSWCEIANHGWGYQRNFAIPRFVYSFLL